ncbi:maleylpyruvate isomerase family mycothiol-dependent enzyme [Streptomyces sp. H34-S4]|uniref:maleylpyruvate isomerase family mycothiol-dependent enzyme n=1 Tax=Streptomyces sp. H34-S4 TaxID=2996463 RepID=UPI002270C099|nr:maleylpyruvate isomerase family mycothiol-dependent enzyme [Streptomyces sp. H34-S4]MCY0939471.1 maleylpyruvate isomerase family mycothiol-dependent enzyme [Streptomyces sp. H34-S4]
MEKTYITEAIAAERRELADVLSALPSASWETHTLCAGWRVREVVAHVTMPFRYSTARFIRELMTSRGNFNRMADRCARRDGQAPTDELVAALRNNEWYPWQPPGGGFEAALTHDVIHGLDITVPLNITRQIPEEHLRIVLETITGPKSLKHFGVGLDGIELRADDIDWSFGTGTPLTGRAQDLALVLCGRKLPAGRLRGMHPGAAA